MELWTIKPAELWTIKPQKPQKPAEILTLKQIILINDYKLDDYPLINNDTIFDDIEKNMEMYTKYSDYSMFSDDDGECFNRYIPIGFSFYKDGFFQIIYEHKWSDGWGGDIDYYYLDLDVNAFYVFMELGFKEYHKLYSYHKREYCRFDNIHKIELSLDYGYY